jgi:DnaJ-class molecular chaperone
MAKDYYQILGVSKNARQEEVKKAYRQLAMQYHPDRNPGRETWANDKFKEINEAFGVLGDPDKRQQYDQYGTVGGLGDIFGSTDTRSTFEDLMRDYGGSGLGFDFLDNVFGDVLQGSSFSFRRGGIRFDAPGGINLEDIFGRAQSPRPEVRYEIAITPAQAAMGTEKELARRGKKLRVKIPAGVRSGTRIKLRGARQITDGQPGDIIIIVRVQ